MGLCIIGAKDVLYYMKYKDAVLIDLRNEDEYESGHITGAINVPMYKLPSFMRRADKNQIHIFYCQHGSMSFQEGKRYIRAGYQICSLAGGMDGYLESKE